MLRFVPPAGTPLEIGQISRAFRVMLSMKSTEECISHFAEHMQVRYAFAASSGRSALWMILKGLRRLRPDRTVVVVPAYTCFSVPASVVRAGLRLYPVDIDPNTLDFDFSQLEAVPDKRILCIVTSNLFGLVNDASRIHQIALAKGAFLVDDAAQALGGTRNGSFAGTFGDVGFYSLARGKALGAVEGGLIVTSSKEIADTIEDEVSKLPAPTLLHTFSLLLQSLSTSIFLHPRLYWIPNSLPFLKLGVTEFDPAFPATSLSAFSCALLPELMGRFSEINQTRTKNATAIAQTIVGNPFFSIPKPFPDCRPVYIRFPLIAKDEDTRDQVVRSLHRAGVGASRFYPSAICDIPGIEQHVATAKFHQPQAEDLSRRLLTLPTHRFFGPSDLKRIAEILGSNSKCTKIARVSAPCA